MAAIPPSRGSARLPLPAATLFVTVVYVTGAAIALVLGGPAQRLLGLAVLAVVPSAHRPARRPQRSRPWS